MQVHLFRLERLCLGAEGGVGRCEINRPSSFALRSSPVRKIVKHEVDGEINLTNLICKKTWEREIAPFYSCNLKDSIEYEVSLRVAGGNSARGRSVVKIDER